jgi:uncharacterized protein (TIGR03083 family)
MEQPTALHPLEPLLVADRFSPLGRELLALLRSLTAGDWARPTVCPAWVVKDIAAHLLDTACRRLSCDRDGWVPPPPADPITGYAELVTHLNRLNARWVEAAERLSPRLLTELLAALEPALAEHLLTLDPFGPALFPVAWAGEDESAGWFDVARELTERWHHQQQIRLAVGAPPLTDPRFSAPVLETFLRALPHRYREVERGSGDSLGVRIEGAQPYRFTLRREEDRWVLLRGEERWPTARVTLPEEPAWRLLTKGMEAEEALRHSRIEGDRALAMPLFSTVAIMG